MSRNRVEVLPEADKQLAKVKVRGLNAWLLRAIGSVEGEFRQHGNAIRPVHETTEMTEALAIPARFAGTDCDALSWY